MCDNNIMHRPLLDCCVYYCDYSHCYCYCCCGWSQMGGHTGCSQWTQRQESRGFICEQTAVVVPAIICAPALWLLLYTKRPPPSWPLNDEMMKNKHGRVLWECGRRRSLFMHAESPHEPWWSYYIHITADCTRLWYVRQKGCRAWRL